MASEAMHSGEIFITKEDQKKLKFVIEQALRSNQEDKRHLKKLKDELIRAHVVDAQDVPADTVTMNSVVSIKDMDTGDEEVYELGYSGYAPDKGNRISVFAPIGMALLGYRAGDEIEWEVPGGMRKIKIIKVLYQPEASGHYDL
ncbi:MAG TPA: nucleoside diphosphate kinase regulator [Candidatus Omnitrophota bacterium]|nr:nucleoside diphosphate kinase regulator [Candidatus Omnitrophota bacterium]